ncbi:MAG TPA: penicillin-binding transpeptidase domain-containing protein [Phycisphaerales bacterium]|nr:penicillin-binding transpeptidase domain-containing protein [Phycisphaerales bacterium]
MPSMFRRRLSILGALVGAATVLPVAQIYRLTIVQGEEHLARAERHLVVERWIPTRRGQILDRKGRVLALNRPSYDIAVDYDVITGQWAFDRARERARREHAQRWATLSREEREGLTQAFLPVYTGRLEAMWARFAATGGVSLDTVERRKDEIRRLVEFRASRLAGLREEAALAKYLGEQARLARGRQIALDEEAPELREIRQRARKPIAEQEQPHVILRGVDDRTAFEFLRLVGNGERADPLDTEALPGLRVIDSSARDYPFESAEVTIERATFPGPLRSDEPAVVRVDGVAAHVLGSMRDRVFREDLEDRARLLAADPDLARAAVRDGVDLGQYLPGDLIGHLGLEAGEEPRLRGLRGRELRHLDTGEIDHVPPTPGTDLRLTLDAALQARVQALFDPSLGLAVMQPWHTKPKGPDGQVLPGVPPDGSRLNGAAVVMEVDTSDVLAMVSIPSYSRRDVRLEPDAVYRDQVNQPILNRAIGKLYQPGSIVKPLVLCAAATNGNFSPGQTIPCTGHFLPDTPNILQCWIWKQFSQTHTQQLGGALRGAQAIMGSCNIFFFELAKRLGPAHLVEWYGRFGVGPRSPQRDLGVGGQFPGLLAPQGQELPSMGEAIQMGIGQGPISWTPLHAASAYATLARGGVRIDPRVRADDPSEPAVLGVTPWAIEECLRGLRMGVEQEQGTSHHFRVPGPDGAEVREPVFNAPGVTVYAKTGTADASALVITDAQGHRRLAADGDHSWTVLLVGPAGDRPRYAVAVVVDYGGSGARVSGPIANQVVHALITEGYLP